MLMELSSIKSVTNRNYNPLTIIILAFMFQSTKLLQSRKVALDGALAHRHSLRHISVRVSDILCVGGGKDYGLELSVSPLPRFSI